MKIQEQVIPRSRASMKIHSNGKRLTDEQGQRSVNHSTLSRSRIIKELTAKWNGIAEGKQSKAKLTKLVNSLVKMRLTYTCGKKFDKRFFRKQYEKHPNFNDVSPTVQNVIVVAYSDYILRQKLGYI